MLKKSKNALILGAAALFSFGMVYANETKENIPAADTKNENNVEDMKKVSEAFGHFIGRNLKSPGVQLDLDSIIKGLRDGAEGKPAPMSDEEYEMKMTLLHERAIRQLATDNLKEANDFLTNNKKNDKVIEIEPGKIQYMILSEGTGDVVAEHGHPLIQYSGKYADGTEFGSSEEVGGPITIPLDQTIPGFSKGIAGMKEGEKRRLFVHPDMGYGMSGHLPPNKLLIFDVEVVKADSKDAKAANDEGLLPLDISDEENKNADEEDDYEDEADAPKTIKK